MHREPTFLLIKSNLHSDIKKNYDSISGNGLSNSNP